MPRLAVQFLKALSRQDAAPIHTDAPGSVQKSFYTASAALLFSERLLREGAMASQLEELTHGAATTPYKQGLINGRATVS